MVSPEAMNIAVKAFLYTAFALSCMLVFHRALKHLVMTVKTRRRLYLGGRNASPGRLDEMLRAAFRGKVTASAFNMACAALFGATFIAGARSVGAASAVMAAAFAAAAPYLMAFLRAKTASRKGSHEGERLVAAFLNQYRIGNCNVHETLEKMIYAESQFPVCRPYLVKLLLELRSAESGERMRQATDAFARAIDTNWGRMLAYNIWLGAGQGMNVSQGVEDILVQLREARTLMEERKRLNAESVRIAAFLVPALYVGSLLLAVRFLGMPLAALLKNQIGTPGGFTLFMMIVLLFFVNMALIEVATNQKLDF